ncbi:hypothetical protein N7481_004946 [Penicillium waksmanii]|uniref:uncharacterized protein n=1 Tax=Penicillium waksmanii TaxID=69791 RepID=UPI0025486EC5|nr:uncharacterized protein N7481_004946 [Penicillium waksmanii]KAJ5982847.1 hypothetical protein N7481_004946 [Penicillium waksmanii]
MALMLASCTYGFGQHVANLTTENKAKTLKVFLTFTSRCHPKVLSQPPQAFYKLTMNMTKMSILMLYLRIFIQRWFRMVCYALLCIIASYMVAAFFASIFQCIPVAKAWNKAIPGSCIDITTNWYANAGFSIATDIIILALPMYPIYNSRIVLDRKIALMMVFALGAFVAVTSIIRMQTLDFSSKSPDTTYDLTSSIWTMIEENMAIICACLPMMWTPLARLFPSFLSTNQRATSNHRSAARGTESNANSRSRNHWVQFDGYSDPARSISMNPISDSQRSTSEDSTGQILPPTGPLHGDEVKYQDRKGIRKVTEYHVSYTTTTAKY